MRIRVTPQILNNTRRRAGLPERGGSLASYLKSGKTGGASRLSAMNARTAASGRTLRNGYEKLESSADLLSEKLSKLSLKADMGSGDISSDVSDLVKHFNDTMKNLKSSSGVLNDYYRQTMKETALGSKDVLEEIGVTVSADGSLSLDKDKLAGADADAVKKALGGSGDFVKRVGAVASRVVDNAKAGMASFSSQYNASGNIMNSYLSRLNYRR